MPQPCTLELPFRCRGLDGTVSVEMRTNEDPRGSGLDLVAPDFDEESFRGFPILTASLAFPGEGWTAWLGWVQRIAHWRNGVELGSGMDSHPLSPGPFYVFGYLPTFSDAPANPDHHDLDWVADAFLVTVEHLRDTRLRPVVGFRWGYRRAAGNRTELIPPSPAGAEEWASLATDIQRQYPEWSTCSFAR